MDGFLNGNRACYQRGTEDEDFCLDVLTETDKV